MANRPPSRLSAKSHPETGEDFLPREWVAPFLSAPLFQRGWTLQERELSTRVLHFTSTDVIYECRECIKRYELASANDCYLDMPFDHSYQFFAEERGWPYRIFDLEDPTEDVCVRKGVEERDGGLACGLVEDGGGVFKGTIHGSE
jgi:hypothetical protein